MKSFNSLLFFVHVPISTLQFSKPFFVDYTQKSFTKFSFDDVDFKPLIANLIDKKE